jgi:hypothetical protein
MEEDKKIMTSVAFDPQTAVILSQKAKQQKTSKAELVRLAVRQYLIKNK